MDNNENNKKVVSDSTEQPNLSIYDESSLKEASKRKLSDAEDSVIIGEEKHRKKKKKSKDRDRKRSKDRDDDRKRSKKDSRDRDRSDRDKDRDRDRDKGSHRDKPSSSSGRERNRDESRERSSRRDGRSSRELKEVIGDTKTANKDFTDKVSLAASSSIAPIPSTSSGKDFIKESSRDRDRDRDRRPSDRDRDDRDRRDRDRASDRDRDRERDKERDRERERDRDRAREKDKEREREREKERERRKERSRTPERSRILVGKTRSPDTRGDRRSYRYDGARGRSNSGERRRNGDGDDKKKDETPGFKPAMLKDIIAANPGISMQEAVVRLNAYNTAVARGMDPGSMNGAIPVYSGPGILPLGMAHLPSATLHSITSGLGVNGVASLGVGGGDPMSKPHRELYIGNLPPGITVPQLAEFINSAMKKLGYSKDTNSVITAWVSPDGHYAFVEVKTVDEANAALTYLNGIQVGAFPIRVGRPKGYNAEGTGSSLAVPMQGGMSGLQMMNPMMMGTVGLGAANPLLVGLNNSMIGGMGLGGLAGMGTTEVMSHVIMCSNLPALINEEQIKELFSPFGELKAFNIIRTSNGASQSAVFEYVDPAIVDGVVAGMNKLELADCKLSVQRIPLSSAAMLLKPNEAPAMIPSAINASYSSSSNGASSSTPDILSDYPPSAVIRLLNMTSPSDLADDTQYNELLEDVSDECNTHGTVKSIVIPRTSDASNGVIFVFFVNVADAQKCLRAVAGRRFNGKVVEGTFYPEELFSRKVYVLPEDYFVHQQQGQGGQGVEEGEEFEIGPSNQPNGGVYQSTDDLDTLD